MFPFKMFAIQISTVIWSLNNRYDYGQILLDFLKLSFFNTFTEIAHNKDQEGADIYPCELKKVLDFSVDLGSYVFLFF